MGLPPMVGLMIEYVASRHLIAAVQKCDQKICIFNHIAKCVRTDFVDYFDDALVLIGSIHSEEALVFVNDGIKPIGMFALTRQLLEPHTVCNEKVVQRSMKALKESTDISAVVIFRKLIDKPETNDRSPIDCIERVAEICASQRPLHCVQRNREFATCRRWCAMGFRAQ